MAGGPDTDPHDVGLAETIAPDPNATQASDAAPVADLGERPVSDRLVRAVSRAKIAGALFASEERVKLGRYHLLELVGSGGMGVVWGAWDPELDRRVAIKLVKATMQSARDRILLEGQALAKLSHPNVVPVFDVGVVEEQVYLVMEWVKGKNLRAYCKEPRTVREIVAVYRDAALGLAAAHHAGLIHRDFKPDNAIRGDDGRVRVLDFGLARGETKPKPDATDTPTNSSDLTRGAGTPRYMPPEQAQGGMLTPAVDQYAWCVSLREALVGRTADGKDADVPGWLDTIITRGIAPDVKSRFASMDDLLRALARDPRTVWRRRAIVTGALGLAGAAFAIGTVRGGSAADKCTGGKEEIAKTWNDQVRTTLLTHVGSLGEYGKDQSSRLDADLTKYSTVWAETHRTACQARARSELTPKLYERSLGCLARANVAFQTVIGVLSKVGPENLDNAIVAARELPLVERCPTEGAADTVAPPAPEIAGDVARVANDVERARVLAFAVDPSAVATAQAAVTSAEQLRYLPLIARANLTLGLADMLQTRSEDAVPPLQRATNAALSANDDVTAVEAYAREVFALVTSQPDQIPPGASDALYAVPIVEPIAQRLGAAGGFARALLYNNVGVSRMAAEKSDEASSWFQRALDERGEVDKNKTELAKVASNLALTVKDRDRRAQLFADSIAELTRLVGENHSFTLETRLKAAMFVTNPVEATAAIQDGCDRLRKYQPHMHALIDRCSFELAYLADERGDVHEARSWMEGISDGEPQRRRVADAYILMLDNKCEPAASDMRALTSELESNGLIWAAGEFADAYVIEARCMVSLGRTKDAVAHLERVAEITERAAATFVIFERRLAAIRTRLARLIIRTDPARGRQLAALAASWYHGAGGYDVLAAEMDRLAQP